MPAEKNYSVSELEYLAVVWAPKTLTLHFVYDTIMVYTDHAALDCLLSIQEPSGHLLRWPVRLAESNFGIAYKKEERKCPCQRALSPQDGS